MGESLATFEHKVVFISDLHLGSGKTAAPYLYEYLKNLDFNKLERIYLVGDVVGGWEMRARKQKPFAEMERRVLDVLNHAAARGIPVHIIPGNHDEKLRPMIEKLHARHSKKIFPNNVFFEQHSFYETAGQDKKRLKVIHGDQFDPQMFVKPWLRPITYTFSSIYDGLVLADRLISKAIYQHLGWHVSLAKRLKNAFKKTVKKLYSHDTLVGGLEHADYDGILMGHTHMAGIHVFKNKAGKETYLINDGDWVESSTCAYVDDKTALPKILNYKIAREEYGFGDLPDEHDTHPTLFAAHRHTTNKQIRIMHKLWPAYDRHTCQKSMHDSFEKVSEQIRIHTQLQKTLDALKTSSCLPNDGRVVIDRIVESMKRASYTPQKEKLKKIFNTYAAHQPLAAQDLLATQTILREFSVRCERKIKKQQDKIKKLRVTLDHAV